MNAMNKPVKTDTIVDVILAVGQVVLIVIGLAGISVQLFSDRGLLTGLLHKLTMLHPATILAAIVSLIVIFSLVKKMFKATKGDRSTSAYGNLLMYMMMGIGAYFVLLFLNTGSLIL